jgi:hypothetical protein
MSEKRAPPPTAALADLIATIKPTVEPDEDDEPEVETAS